MRMFCYLLLLATLCSGCSTATDESRASVVLGSSEIQEAIAKVDSGEIANPILNVSPRAAKALQAAVGSEAKYVRATCTPGGCSGFIYDLAPVDDKLAGDLFISAGNLQVVVDSNSAKHFRGTTLDYVSENGEVGFKFENPNKPPVATESN